jgi:hypothetical protein
MLAQQCMGGYEAVRAYLPSQGRSDDLTMIAANAGPTSQVQMNPILLEKTLSENDELSMDHCHPGFERMPMFANGELERRVGAAAAQEGMPTEQLLQLYKTRFAWNDRTPSYDDVGTAVGQAIWFYTRHPQGSIGFRVVTGEPQDPYVTEIKFSPALEARIRHAARDYSSMPESAEKARLEIARNNEINALMDGAIQGYGRLQNEFLRKPDRFLDNADGIVKQWNDYLVEKESDITLGYNQSR